MSVAGQFIRSVSVRKFAASLAALKSRQTFKMVMTHLKCSKMKFLRIDSAGELNYNCVFFVFLLCFFFFFGTVVFVAHVAVFDKSTVNTDL